MKKNQQKRARKLARRPAPKPRGRGGRGSGILANAWRSTPAGSNDGDVALATMLTCAVAARRK